MPKCTPHPPSPTSTLVSALTLNIGASSSKVNFTLVACAPLPRRTSSAQHHRPYRITRQEVGHSRICTPKIVFKCLLS